MAAPVTSFPTSPAMQRKQAQLVVMRRRATLLLAAVTAVFIGTVVGGATSGSFLGYVQATAEASMVGGLADWFAVVAIFRHPLNLPIPHTAIIPERKAAFGETLGEFIQSSFLTPDAVAERVQAADVGGRVARWLADPANAAKLAGHAADAAVQVADLLRDEEIQAAVDSAVRTRIEGAPLAPMAGKALDALTRDRRHDELVDVALHGLAGYLDVHRDELHRRFEDSAPWWLPGAVEDRIFQRLLDGARNVLEEMVRDHDHDLRRLLDERLAGLAHELQTSPELRARGDQLAHDLLGQPELRAWVAGLWQEAKDVLRSQAADPESELRRTLAGAIASAGQRLLEDPVLAEKVSTGAEQAVRYVVEHFGGEITNVVSTTISRWDGEETAQRLELLLGPDLQFIRINGTVVGGMAGLLLHTIAQVLR